MTKVTIDQRQKNGYFYITNLKTKKVLKIVSAFYFLIMLIRFFVMLDGMIPIIFHWVLAGYIYLLTQESKTK